MKTVARIISVLLAFVMLSCVLSVSIGAISISDTVVLSTYTADFESNYFSDLNSSTCTDASITKDNGSNVLNAVIKSNTTTHRFEIYNSQNGNLTLNNGKVYAVTVSYKVVRIGNEIADAPTTVSLVRYNGTSDELVKIEALPNSVYYPGDTTDWITETVVFKASLSATDAYNRLAINVVSSSCSDVETSIESRTTSILFDNITVAECAEDTKTIEFVSNGGERCAPMLARSGETVELPVPERDLYVFEGWYTDTKLTKQFKKSTMPGDMTTKLYAKWKYSDEAVVVSYTTNNGETVEPSVGREGDALTLPSVTRIGFHFAGWYDKSYKTKQEPAVFPTESVTLYAKWEPIPQLCSFENPDVFPEPSGGAVSKRYEITDKSASDGTYSLYYDYWKAYPESTGVTGFARCILRDEYGDYIRVEEGKAYSVTFKYKVTGIDQPTKMGEYFGIVTSAKGSAWTSPALQMEYYDGFKYSGDVGKGWKTCTINFTAKPLDDSSNYLSIGVGGVSQVYIDQIFVYQYDKNFKYPNSGMMLCFDTQGGPSVDTVYAERGTEVTLPTPTREGYRFGGWYYDAMCMEPVETETLKLDKIYTLLYAEWFDLTPEPEQPVEDIQPEPQPEPEPEPVVQPEPQNDKTVLYILITAVAVVVAAAVITVVAIKKRKSKDGPSQ